MSIKVVQFLHSGEEYKQSEFIKTRGKTIKPWNTGGHKRKFLHAKGAYIDNNETTQEEEEKKGEDIYFWGEWEPDSEVSLIKNPAGKHYPHFIHKPFLRLKKSEQITKGDKNPTPTNTDPFVFGKDGFYYSCCMQSRYKKLKQLEPGSIILFGSAFKRNTSDAYFALDTVFVVGDDKNKLKYNINNDLSELKEFAPKYYCDIMNYKSSENEPNCSCNKSKSEGCEKETDFTCYRGASYDKPINGMYSFAPCKIGSEGKKGFKRVMLTENSFKDIFDDAIISNNNAQGVNYTKTNNIQDNFKIWTKLREIIKENECYEAVKLNYTVR